MPELYQTADLLDIQLDDRAAPPDGFWLRFYPLEHRSEAQMIYFDQLPTRDRRLAPFVSPNVQGRVMRSKGTTLASFAPAYVKPKHVVDPSRAITRRAGEPVGGLNSGSLTLEQRFDAIVADNMRTERELIERRWDHMAAMAAIYGEVTVEGEDYPSVTVSFNRHSSLTYVLVGAAQWDEQTTGDPMANISAARKNAFARGKAPVKDLIFGLDAWDAFASHPKIVDLLDKMKGGSNSEFNRTGLRSGEPFEYQGEIGGPNGGGRIRMWTYSNQWEDGLDGTPTEYLDPRDVVGIGEGFAGVRAFGAIMDKKAGLRAIPMFPKMWDVEDPSVVYTMTQSAPLMVPLNANNSFRIRTL